jgi:hypothetical protein
MRTSRLVQATVLGVLLCCWMGCSSSTKEHPTTGSGGMPTSGTGGSIAGSGGGTSTTGSGGAGSDGGVMAGPIDAVIAQMPPGSWKDLPGTQMSDVCPPPYEHYGCDAVMSAWSGGAFDSVRDRLVIFGGGHSDSYYNNVFAFDLASMTWLRMTELPAGVTGTDVPPVFQDKRIETCGLYPSGSTLTIPDAWLTPTGYLSYDKCDDPSIAPQLDPQQPRSRHTYGDVAFSAATGHFYLLGAVALYPSGQSGTARVMSFDFASKQWSRVADNPSPGFGASAADENGHIWYIGGSGKLLDYDPTADTWTPQASDAMGSYYAGAAVDTKRHTLVLTADGLKLTTYAIGQAGAPVTTVTTTGLSAPPGQAPGLEYDPVLDRFVAWAGGQTVYFIDPQTWQVKAVQGTGDVATPAAQNGTFGRFRYSPARDVFVGVNATQGDVFIYKPPAAAP